MVRKSISGANVHAPNWSGIQPIHPSLTLVHHADPSRWLPPSSFLVGPWRTRPLAPLTPRPWRSAPGARCLPRPRIGVPKAAAAVRPQRYNAPAPRRDTPVAPCSSQEFSTCLRRSSSSAARARRWAPSSARSRTCRPSTSASPPPARAGAHRHRPGVDRPRGHGQRAADQRRRDLRGAARGPAQRRPEGGPGAGRQPAVRSGHPGAPSAAAQMIRLGEASLAWPAAWRA